MQEFWLFSVLWIMWLRSPLSITICLLNLYSNCKTPTHTPWLHPLGGNNDWHGVPFLFHTDKHCYCLSPVFWSVTLFTIWALQESMAVVLSPNPISVSPCRPFSTAGEFSSASLLLEETAEPQTWSCLCQPHASLPPSPTTSLFLTDTAIYFLFSCMLHAPLHLLPAQLK